MTWIDDATRATTRAELEHAWWAGGAMGQREARDSVWFVALAARLSDVDAAAMNVVIKQLGGESFVAM
jgi:hypothetical protein